MQYQLKNTYLTTAFNGSTGQQQTISFLKDRIIEGEPVSDGVNTTQNGTAPPPAGTIGGPAVVKIPLDYLTAVSSSSTNEVTDPAKAPGKLAQFWADHKTAIIITLIILTVTAVVAYFYFKRK